MKIPKGIYTLAKQLNKEELALPYIAVENRVIGSILPYLKENGYNNVTLVVDKNTYEVAGKRLEEDLLDDGIRTHTVQLVANSNKQVIADEATLIQILVETPNHTDIYVAVGSGTIHDLVRFSGYKTNIPFISVPTAASVDGFTSKGAPLILRGVKQTIQTASPVAVFADIDIVKEAPKEMTAAGFGDILAKYTSLFDWEISKLIGEEPYNELASRMTRRTLTQCVNSVDKIAHHDDEGIKILMNSLIESGLIMLLLNYSRPASGGEHHLSHYWEMDLLKREEKQMLHGAKVGVATAIIVELYKQRLETIPSQSSSNWEKVLGLLERLPSPEEVRQLLHQVGGPTTTEDLDLDDELVKQSLNEAFLLRDRCTGLQLINRFKKSDLPYPLV
ncbi:sn-glycerol-1-phosphate dehydrogenase [Radiobacillus kanasensis]|uniref:sn-glycerol-1-phosphate dehydrogenase n=1 Tax=Radiobacillus kanasensis TaxID=2844358 RepID=UPI001E410059|nr:sn-glycerol-1-phosphate dehydrogenase [Radiobacillus kanasensis]UFT99769.1 sn-glycerol-1-phosphate dehydrogenase [Radiobacillus kanasensis]